MAQFFETRMGQKFYEGQVPRLVKALERIADALEKTPLTAPPLTAADPDDAIPERAFVAQVALLLKDGERAPGVDAEHDEGDVDDFVLSSDDAVETLHSLITQARALREPRR